MVRSIAANHALADGNKRLAITVLHSTLLTNGYAYMWTDDEAVALALRAATGDTDFRWLAEFIEMWSFVTSGDPIAFEREALDAAIREAREALSVARPKIRAEAAWDITSAVAAMASRSLTPAEREFLRGYREVLHRQNPRKWPALSGVEDAGF